MVTVQVALILRLFGGCTRCTDDKKTLTHSLTHSTSLKARARTLAVAELKPAHQARTGGYVCMRRVRALQREQSRSLREI